MVPQNHRLHQIQPQLSPLCWKRCGEIATYMNFWWICPSIQHFWAQVTNSVSEIIGLQILLAPEIALLNHWREKSISPLLQELTSMLYVTARLTLAQCWKRPLLPQLKHWHSKVVELIIIISKVSDQTFPSSKDEDGYTHYDL